MAACFTVAELEELARYDEYIDSLEMTEEDYTISRSIDALTLTKEQRRSREYYQENREKYRAYQKGYYEAHKEDVKTYKAEWYKANRERIRKQQTEYYEANRQKANARNMSELHKIELKCRVVLKRNGMKLEKRRSAPGLSCDPEHCRYRISAGDQSGSDYPLRIEDVMQAAGIA